MGPDFFSDFTNFVRESSRDTIACPKVITVQALKSGVCATVCVCTGGVLRLGSHEKNYSVVFEVWIRRTRNLLVPEIN